MARKKIKNSNIELANSLTTWARERSLQDDVYVEQITGALENGTDLDFWAQYDAFELLPFPEVVEGAREGSWAETLMVARNIMVFVPVAFTWAAISQATEAFSRYSEANPNKIANFFDFWENGYGVLNEFWKLSNVAKIDFFLLAIVILGSIGVAYLQKNARTKKNLSRMILERERMGLALQINKYFSDFRVVTPLVINQNISSMLRDLKTTTASLQKIVKSTEKNATELARGSVVREQLAGIKKSIDKLIK